MRELKFRAWDGERMKQVSTLGFTDDAFVSTPKGSGPREDYELMQYTGLKDKNGKEIYEGDVVRWDSGELDKITWNEDMATFTFAQSPVYPGTKCAVPLGALDLQQIEVIGNIYENPELTT